MAVPIPAPVIKKQSIMALGASARNIEQDLESLSPHSEDAKKYAATVAISALVEIEKKFAAILTPLVEAEAYKATKKKPVDEALWCSLGSSLDQGPIFTLETLAANGHADVVASTVLPWLPAFLAHKGLASAKGVGAGQPTFDR